MSRSSRGSSTEKYNSVFATRLRLLFDERPNVTQAQLSETIGVTRQTISQYVNGISEPRYDALVKIADYFDVSIDYLLGRTTTRTTNLSISCQAAEIPTHGLPINPLPIGFVFLTKTEQTYHIENADRKFNLRLDELLTAKDADFVHDIAGIINNINRADGFPATDFGLFVPRFASNDI